MKTFLLGFILIFLSMSFLKVNAQPANTFIGLKQVSAGIAAIDPTLPDPNEPNVYTGWNYAWGDEFNYTGKPDPAMWSYEKGFTRNQELQWYQEANANVSSGRLLIEGRRETFKNPNYQAGSGDWKTNREYVNYTSSSIITLNKRQFYKGRIEVRAKLDTRKGNWPAIWTLGQNKEWPPNGEIDILEYYLIGGTPSILHNFAWGTETRWVAKWNGKSKPLTYFTDKDPDWVNKYHVWRMDWDDTTIKLYIDDELLNSQVIKDAKNADGSIAFDQPQYMLLNLALGGNGGDPSSTVFPTKYEVDYFRVYQKTVDVEKPSVVSNIVASNISNSSCTLTWDASTDNVRVVAYHVYNNGKDAGAYMGSTTTNTFQLNGLSSSSTNKITVRALDAVGNYSDFPTGITVKTVPSLSGTVMSYGDIYENNANNAPAKVFDNNASTFYDANIASGAWVGLDLKKTYKIDKIRFCPRSGHYPRMTGGKFQGSNQADFSSEVVDLYTIATELPAGSWGEILVENTSAFRYVRYLSPANGFCNVAEIEFYGQQTSAVSETMAFQWNVFPNPVRDCAHFLWSGASEEVELIISNIAGQLVVKKQITMVDGYKLDLSTLANGLYLVNVNSNSFNTTKRLYKIS